MVIQIKKFLKEKNVKIKNKYILFKDYASPYNVEVLNSFNPELQLEDTESAIKNELKNIGRIKSI